MATIEYEIFESQCRIIELQEATILRLIGILKQQGLTEDDLGDTDEIVNAAEALKEKSRA